MNDDAMMRAHDDDAMIEHGWLHAHVRGSMAMLPAKDRTDTAERDRNSDSTIVAAACCVVTAYGLRASRK